MSSAKSKWRWLLARLGTLGWGALVASVLLLLLEWSGVGTTWVHQILAARLAPLGGELHLAKARFQWLEPALILEGLSYTTDEEVLSAEHLHVRFGWQGGLRLAPTMVHLRGARVVLDPALANGVRGLLNIRDREPEMERSPRELPLLPEVLIEDLTVLVETGTGARIVVLHVDLLLDTETDRPRIVGRVQTPRQRTAGAPGSIRLSGGVNANGLIELRSQALALDITPQDIPNALELASIREWNPHGTLDLEVRVFVDLLHDVAPRAEFTGRLSGASLRPPGAVRPLEDIELRYAVSFDPRGEDWLWDTRAWEGVATARGGFADETFEAGALLGRAARDDAHFEAWLKLEDIDLATPLDELLSDARWFGELHTAASPSGAFTAKISTRLLRQRAGDTGPAPAPEMLLLVDVAPGTRIQYAGWPSRSETREPVGFPMPARITRGEITYAYTHRFARRGLTRIDLELMHASGPATVRYLERSAPIDRPPFAGGSEVHLTIHVPKLAIDAEFQSAIRGLDPILGEGTIWRDYAPTGGDLGVNLYLAHLPGYSITGARLDIEVREVGCTLAAFPVPADAASGRIQVLSGLDGETATAWELSGHAGAASFRVAGRDRSRRTPEGERERVLGTLTVEARGVDVDGPAIAVLEESVRDSIAALVLVGAVDADLATYAAGPFRRTLELRPVQGLSATPVGFPDRVDTLVGTLRLAWNDPDPEDPIKAGTTGWVPGIEGVGTEGERVVFTGSGTPTGWGGAIFGTGIRAARWSADDALASSHAETSALTLRGVVDIMAILDRAAAPDSAAAPNSAAALEGAQAPAAHEESAPPPSSGDKDVWKSKIEVVLRANTLTDEGSPLLEELSGTLTLKGAVITAPRVAGRLGETLVLFENLSILNEPTGFSLSTDIQARGVPLDSEHLGALLEEERIATLIEELGLRGDIDVEEGTLQVIAARGGSPTVRFRGSLAIADMALDAGLPVVVRSARAIVHDLIIEDGELRGWGRIENLYGDCFENELGPVSALVTYVGGVLVVEDFSGSFERGRIRPLDGEAGALDAVRGRPALSIALRPPFPYRASIAVDDVDASRWLEGISADAVSGSGTLSIRADLAGNLGALTETTGRGSIHLERSELWSIPLFRELLREFGLDHTVMFDEVSFTFDLDDQVLHMEDVVLRSPLLKLVGEGTLDMEGRLNHSFEVHYSIVDKIAPLRRLFYLVQNLFVTVKLRGDLSQPLVLLSNGLFSLFRAEPDIVPSLPLPGLSPLPPRF